MLTSKKSAQAHAAGFTGLSLYAEAPAEELTLEDFEIVAFDRLKGARPPRVSVRPLARARARADADAHAHPLAHRPAARPSSPSPPPRQSSAASSSPSRAA